MTSRQSLQDRLAGGLTRVAANRVRGRYPEWADAMVNEQAHLAGEKNQLRWALGSLRASFNLHDAADAGYLALLLPSVAAMVLYQWSADEGVVTLLVISLLGLCLGLCSPRRFLISGIAVGVVVTAVNSFETLSGIRPVYELHAHSLVDNLRWLVLVAPALASSALGRKIKLSLFA